MLSSDVSTNKTFTTPSGQGVTVGAGGQTFSYDPTSNTIRPSLNATFPTTPEGTKTTSVVTSKPALDNNLKIGNELKQATTDLGSHQTAINTPTPQPEPIKTSETPPPPTVDDQINELMKSLGYDLSQTAELTPEQKQTIVEDTQAQGLDNSQLDPSNPDSVASKVSAMLNGSYPLSTTEQASVNNVANQFQGALQDAQTYAKNVIGGATVANAKNGLQMYSPAEAMSNMAKVVKEGNDKIQTINTRILDAQNKLTQTLKDNDFKQANDLYTKISDDLKLRTTEINDMNKSVQDMTKQMHDDAENAYKDQLQAMMDDHTISYQDKTQAISQANLDEKTRHDMATEVNQAAVTSPAQNLPQVSMNADNTVNPTDQTNFLSNLPGGATGELATLVKGISNYTINPSSIPTRQYKGVGGLTQAQVIALASQYDPSFSQSNYANRQALVKNFQSGNYSKNINSLNTAVGHLADLQSNFDKLDNAGFTPYNHLKNSVEQAFGKGGVASAGINISAVMGELASTFKGAGATDQEIKNLGTVDVNSSPQQIQSFIETATQLLASRLNALEDTYQSGMGKAPNKGFLSFSASDQLLQLQNKGYNIQVPELAKNPTVLLKTFNDSAPENATLLQQLQQTMPKAKPDEVVSWLENHGKLQ